MTISEVTAEVLSEDVTGDKYVAYLYDGRKLIQLRIENRKLPVDGGDAVLFQVGITLGEVMVTEPSTTVG